MANYPTIKEVHDFLFLNEEISCNRFVKPDDMMNYVKNVFEIMSSLYLIDTGRRTFQYWTKTDKNRYATCVAKFIKNEFHGKDNLSALAERIRFGTRTK
jgi:hypothetical protein